MKKRELILKNPNSPEMKSYSEALKRGRQIKHVVPMNKGWAVKDIVGNKPIKEFNRKEEAVAHAKKLAQNAGSELIVHRKDGKIQGRFNYDR